jgi:hypothetical protein
MHTDRPESGGRGGTFDGLAYGFDPWDQHIWVGTQVLITHPVGRHSGRVSRAGVPRAEAQAEALG